MSGRRLFFVSITLVILVSLFCSCGPKTIGYGVVLWSTDSERIADGTLVPVYEDSSIRDIYVIGFDETDATMEFPRNRISFFNKEKEAAAFSEKYGSYRDLFAKTLKDGLAVRSEPDERTDRVYKLREGQVIKVLDKLEPAVIIGDYEGYWYRVMTEEGIAGFCFGRHLDIFDKTSATGDTASLVEAPRLEAFLGRIYRPEYYKDMLDEQRIDLDRFTPEYGIFSNTETKRIRIVLPDQAYSVEYESIEQTGGDRYSFFGSSLEVVTLTMNKVVLSLSTENGQFSGTFYYIDGIEDLRTAEQERREALKAGFGDLGSLKSAAYGALSFEEGGVFVWNNYDRLIPSVIPAKTGSTGDIRFDRFLAADLKVSYDGAVTFSFREEPDREFCFLYTISDNGLRLVFVPEGDIEDGLVIRENPSPIVLFFSP